MIEVCSIRRHPRVADVYVVRLREGRRRLTISVVSTWDETRLRSCLAIAKRLLRQ